jgi:hypothetical protein
LLKKASRTQQTSQQTLHNKPDKPGLEREKGGRTLGIRYQVYVTVRHVGFMICGGHADSDELPRIKHLEAGPSSKAGTF